MCCVKAQTPPPGFRSARRSSWESCQAGAPAPEQGCASGERLRCWWRRRGRGPGAAGGGGAGFSRSMRSIGGCGLPVCWRCADRDASAAPVGGLRPAAHDHRRSAGRQLPAPRQLLAPYPCMLLSEWGGGAGFAVYWRVWDSVSGPLAIQVGGGRGAAVGDSCACVCFGDAGGGSARRRGLQGRIR